MRLARVRFRIRRLMLLVVIAAVLSAIGAQGIRTLMRRRDEAMLRRRLVEYHRALARARWADQMHRKGYLPRRQVDRSKESLRQAKQAIRERD